MNNDRVEQMALELIASLESNDFYVVPAQLDMLIHLMKSGYSPKSTTLARILELLYA